MEEYMYLCRSCRSVFNYSVTADEPQVRCISCGGTDLFRVSSWVPVNFNGSQPLWEYECRQCRNVFKRPVPRSPSQEKEIECPVCGGSQVRRLTVIGGAPLYCG